ncbi:DUF2815 domain-containing protein [Rhizobium rhizogenes]|uniref:DUF2815 domain-containing protein n=1 Tax=Rhizobium rhizogenes TaxID=359 RepID=UPI001574E2F2|nr:DUF2815 domain-containing protein [Rhizobium rhizogenes]NTH18434.1 DUF2815 domain-containing protein [Rhizobium rhizogenes]NTH31407.1 DUF2815 domain-containing protein [Rhizobium rhizogenes]
MANEKSKRPEAVKITTPRAPAVYPKLDFANPDYGTEAYPIEGGAFSVQVRLVKSDPQVQALLAKLEKVMAQSEAEALEKFAALPVATRKKLGEPKRQEFYTDVYDEEENETGEIILKFKMKHSGTTAKGKDWKRYPQLIDAKLQKLKKGTAIWGGSIVRVSGGALPYWVAGQASYGVSLQLEGVQVIELVSAGGRSASEMGFEEEEGYDASEGFSEEDTTDDSDDNAGDEKAPAGSDDF